MESQQVLVVSKIFPAKLWYLVNNPEISGIGWDSQGESVIVNKDLAERALSFSDGTLKHSDTFRPIKFSSFIRDLYAYGFTRIENKPDLPPGVYQFSHPDFKRSHPERLLLLSRRSSKYPRKCDLALAADAQPGDRAVKSDVCVQCEDGDGLHEEVDEPTTTPDFKRKPQPQFCISNNRAGPSTSFNRPQKPQPKYLQSCDVAHLPSPVPAFSWYQKNQNTQGFCSVYQLGYIVHLDPLPGPPFAPRMLCPSGGLQKSCTVTQPSVPSPASQQLPVIITGPGSSSPAAEAGASIQDTPTKQT